MVVESPQFNPVNLYMNIWNDIYRSGCNMSVENVVKHLKYHSKNGIHYSS